MRREDRWTRVAAVLVLIGLAMVAAYAMFSGPTTVPLPTSRSQVAPAARSAPAQSEQEREGGRND